MSFVKATKRDLVNLKGTNADRPADWRWQRAVLLEHRGLFGHLEEPSIQQARSFIQAGNRVSVEQLANKYPLLYEVHRIHSNASHTRWMLEALIMADVPAVDIAGRFGWTERGEELVGLYEQLKFDVRSRLKFDTYIQSEVLGVSGNVYAPSEDKILKIFGYVGNKRGLGTKLLDCYVSLDDMTGDVKNWFEGFVSQQFTKKTVRALLRGDPSSSELLLDTIRVFHDSQKLEMDKKTRGMQTSGSDVEKAMERMTDSLKMTVVSISQTQNRAIEPRSNEIIDESIVKLLDEQVASSLKARINADTTEVEKD